MQPGRAADHSPPSSAAVMEEYSYTSTHPLVHTGPVTESLYLFFYIHTHTHTHTHIYTHIHTHTHTHTHTYTHTYTHTHTHTLTHRKRAYRTEGNLNAIPR